MAAESGAQKTGFWRTFGLPFSLSGKAGRRRRIGTYGRLKQRGMGPVLPDITGYSMSSCSKGW